MIAGLLLLLLAAPAARGPRSPEAIQARLLELFGDELRGLCRARGVTFPPDAVLLRAYKRERELEVWAGNGPLPQARRIAVFPMCAVDAEPGPKLARGDGKTPEGRYHPAPLFGSNLWFMWMRLEPDRIDEPGEVGEGSSFRLCVEYPTPADRARTRAAGLAQPGDGICLHGNCVSAGCLSLPNRDFARLFALTRGHDARRHGPLELHIFPFRFAGVDLQAEVIRAGRSPALAKLGPRRLLALWTELRELAGRPPQEP